jgi:outer membrane protein assembly factor BamB
MLMVIVICAIGALSSAGVSAADWTMWRCDAQRTAYTPEELPETLHLQWVLDLPEPEACWPPEQIRLQFDVSYEPIAAGGMLFVPSMVRDSVTAYDAKTGEEAWRFYADGPVRFAPIYWKGKVYFASDDSCLYCLNALDGALIWRFRGAPADYRVLGNERLVSAWPARGAPVLSDGTVYFAASIWPFMGTFYYAIDAETGDVIWENSGSGSDYVLQPHSSPAFAGVAPQGYLAVAGDVLVVPGGRSVPAGYDRRTGRFLYHHADTKDGEYAFFVGGDYVFNQGRMARASDGGHVRHVDASIIMGNTAVGVDGEGNIRATALEPEVREKINRKGETEKERYFPTGWVLPGDATPRRVFIGAGSRLYIGNGEGFIAAVDLPEDIAAEEDKPATVADRVSWATEVDGKPWTMLAAEGRLFVVTRSGRIYCFGRDDVAPRGLETGPVTVKRRKRDPFTSRRVRRILEATGVRDGYCVVAGLGDGKLIEDIVTRTDFHVIGLDPDAERVNGLRRRFDDAGIYGKRVSLLPGHIEMMSMAPYFADAVIVTDGVPAEEVERHRLAERVFHILRPYGGIACLLAEGKDGPGLARAIESKSLPGCEVKDEGDMVLLRRKGPLPGSAPWTHQYGDVANTVCSKDSLVKPPLALLWFGGPSHVDVLPRHGHGPCQQVIGGRLFIEGINVFSARDVYTGRVLWKKELPELNTFGMYYNETFNPDPYDRSYNQVHIPGANLYGSNFVATEDRVYLIQGATCLVLDAVTGETLAEWTLPEKDGIGAPKWGHLGVFGDRLIAGVAPYEVVKKGEKTEIIPNNRYSAASKYLVVMDRRSGEVLWEREAEYNFRHNTIVAGSGKVFCIDGMSDFRLDLMKRRGVEFDENRRILALDLTTGEELWSAENAFGTWLGYSKEYDTLIEGGSRAGDRAGDEVGEGMAARRGEDGTPLWRIGEAYSGPPILHHEKIITQTGGGNTGAPPAKVFDITTGKRVMTTHPLTGEDIPFEWVRFKGCNTAVAGEHILTFRSASACYADLDSGAGTASIGGFKSGCTSNLVPADGVLNAPDYTRTCTCSYQNQTSLALVHAGGDYPWPDVEGWSFDALPVPGEPAAVERVGINFGAPGNRYDKDGTLWLECPSVGGPSPEIPVSLEAAGGRLFRSHMSEVGESGDDALDELRWVAASGIEGVTRVVIRPFLQPGDPAGNRDIAGFERNAGTDDLPRGRAGTRGSYENSRDYMVKLIFSENGGLGPGDRIFDIRIQGERVREGFDVAAAAAGTRRPVGIVFEGVPVKDELCIDLIPAEPDTERLPVLSGIEIRAQ